MDFSDRRRPPAASPSPRTLALRLLARREHSRHELIAKLEARGVAAEAAASAVDELAAQGHVDDRRAADSHVRNASRVKGRGPRRIRRELETRGIDGATIAAALEAVSADDVEAALSRFLSRRHPQRPIAPADRARLFRQLLGRGFSADAIAKALK